MAEANANKDLSQQSTNLSTRDEEIKSAGQPLSDFLLQLEDYTPTVSILYVLLFWTHFYNLLYSVATKK